MKKLGESIVVFLKKEIIRVCDSVDWGQDYDHPFVLAHTLSPESSILSIFEGTNIEFQELVLFAEGIIDYNELSKMMEK